MCNDEGITYESRSESDVPLKILNLTEKRRLLNCDKKVYIGIIFFFTILQMTGRKGRVVCNDEGITYESRSESDVPLEILNLTEKQRFMDGEKVYNQFMCSVTLKVLLCNHFFLCIVFTLLLA